MKLWDRIVPSPIIVNPRLTMLKANMSPWQLTSISANRVPNNARKEKKNTRGSRYGQVNASNQAHVDVPSPRYFVRRRAWMARHPDR